MGHATVESELAYRRLKWLQAVIRDPAETVQLRAEVFGWMALDPEGITDYNPWVVTWIEDLKRLLERQGVGYNLNAQLEEHGLSSLVDVVHMGWFLDMDPVWLRHPGDDDTKPEVPTDPLGEKEYCLMRDKHGNTCMYYNEKRKVAAHQRKEHGVRSPTFPYVLTNQCPKCRKVFSGRDSAGEHVRTMYANGGICPRPKVACYPPTLVPVGLPFTCEECGVVLGEHDEVQQHMLAHILGSSTPAEGTVTPAWHPDADTAPF